MRDKSRIVKEIEELYKRMKLYNKKMNTMGLDDREKQAYMDMLGEYVKLKALLADSVYDEYIFSSILNGKARSVYMEINKMIGWNGELLVEERDIDRIIDMYNKVKDKDELVHKVSYLYNLLRKNLEEYRKKLNDEEFLSEISLLLSNGMVEDFEIIQDYLWKKFDILYFLMENAEEI